MLVVGSAREVWNFRELLVTVAYPPEHLFFVEIYSE